MTSGRDTGALEPPDSYSYSYRITVARHLHSPLPASLLPPPSSLGRLAAAGSEEREVTTVGSLAFTVGVAAVAETQVAGVGTESAGAPS